MAQDLPHLSLLSPLRGEHRLACVALTHNEMRILPEFLAHYRRLGVDRFFLVDDHSTDGSRDYLMAQDDVTLYEPRPGSVYSKDKRFWRAELLDAFAVERWVVVPDIDEHLVYPGCESRDLFDLVAALQSEGADALHATMVDMYRDAPMLEQRHDSQTLLDSFPLFDGPDHYFRIAAPGKFRKKYPTPQCMAIGGMRQRLFEPLAPDPAQMAILRRHCDIAGPFSGGPLFRVGIALTRWRLRSLLRQTNLYNMSKVPLLRWRRGLTYYNGAHAVSAEMRLSRHSAALLHFKMAGGVDATQYAANRGQHANGSAFYKSMLEHMNAAPSPRFEGSVRYVSSASMARLLS